MKYLVTSTIQSRDLSNPPAVVSWYAGENLGLALAALVSAGSSNEAKDEGDLPESMRYDVLAVHMSMTPEVSEPSDTAPFNADQITAFRTAYSLLGDGHGKEWADNIEYTRAVLEVTRDFADLGGLNLVAVEQIIRTHGAY